MTEEGYAIFEPAYSKLPFVMFKMLKDHKKLYGQEMTGHELACRMSDYLEVELNSYEYLRFQPRECSLEDIVDNIPFLIDCYNGDASNTKYPVKLEMLGAVKPVTFRQALKVYKLRQNGMSFHEIARLVVPHRCTKGESVILQKNAYNSVLRLYKKCGNLIRNAESGVFPGAY